MSPSGVVERFLAAMTAHDWETMGACVSPTVERVGPFGDIYRGRSTYVDFIAGLLPDLPGYQMEVSRISYPPGGRLAFVELAETVALEGRPHRTPEALVFELDDANLIERIAVYIQRPEGSGFQRPEGSAFQRPEGSAFQRPEG